MRKEVLVKVRPFKESVFSVHACVAMAGSIKIVHFHFILFLGGKIGGLRGQKPHFSKPLWEVWRITSPEFYPFQTNGQKVEDLFGYDITVTIWLNLRANIEGYKGLSVKDSVLVSSMHPWCPVR